MAKQIQTVEKQIKKLIDGNETLSKNAQLLQSIPGVGFWLSSIFLSELPELGKIGRGEIASLVGVCPLNRDSGRFRGKRLIYGGRARVRRALYMGTISAIRFNYRVQAHFNQLSQRGFAFKKAMVPCMRKLLFIANAVLKTQTPWKPQQQVA